MSVAALVLAAGRAARYRAAGGRHPTKLVDLFAGEALVRHPVRAALGAGLPVLVVTGHAAEAVSTALDGLAVRFVHNAAYATGLASSLRVGLGALGPDVAAALILLGDMPMIDVATLQALLAASELQPDAEAVVPVADGVRGNPVLLRRSLFAAAAALSGDEGARRLLRDPGLRVVEVPSAAAAVRIDIDAPGDLAGRAGSETRRM